MIPLYKIMEFYHRPSPAVLTMPGHLLNMNMQFLNLSQRARWRLIIFFSLVILGAMVAYVWAVNAMLFDGLAIQKGNAVVATLEREHSDLGSVLAERQSPSWLEEAARINGMVEVSDVRYLKSAQSVALLR